MNINNIKRLNEYLKQYNVSNNSILFDLLDNSHDIIIFKTPAYKNVWINRKLNTLFDGKITEREFIEKKCYQRLYDRETPCPECIIEKAKQTKQIEETEYYVPEPDNNTYLMKAYPVINNQEKLVGLFIFHLKISKRKTLKKEIKRERDKVNFFTNLSHEFRTPLNLMHSSLQIMKMQFDKLSLKKDKKAKFKRYINVIQQNNYRLLKLVNNLLDLNKMDVGEYNIKFENRDIVDLIKKITLSCISNAEEQNKKLNFISDIKEKTVAIDPFEIERIILNLISNAFKFTNPGDTITVRLKERNDIMKIIVEDTGVGIPGEKQKTIFDKFIQADKSLRRQSEGSGIGLSLVKLLVQLHGGKISLKSRPGKGSKFIINLPTWKKEGGEEKTYSKKSNTMIDRKEIEFSDIYV